jgi:hypothetical protein
LRQKITPALIVLTSLVMALLLCEGGLRLLGIEYPHFYDYDPVIGARLRPGMKGYWLHEGGGYVSINNDGLRDREHVIAKPLNTLRIAVLGDSFAEAMQVNQEETFGAILEKELQRCGNLHGRNIEVLNFGVAGFGTTQELLTLQHRVWKYSPDIVLLAFTPGNDVSDNSPALNQRPACPFLVLRDGRLVLDDSRLKRIEETLLSDEKHRNWLGHIMAIGYTWRNDNSRILQLMDRVRYMVQEQRSSKDSPEHKQGVAGGGMFTAMYHEPTDEDWKEAWKITEAVLLKMRDEVAQKGAQFDVVVLSSDAQVHPDAAIRKALANHPGVEDVFYPDHWVERLCQSHGIPVLLLGPSFHEYASQHQVFLHGFRTLFRNTLGYGHWNQHGHHLAGDMIAKWLCGQLH